MREGGFLNSLLLLTSLKRGKSGAKLGREKRAQNLLNLGAFYAKMTNFEEKINFLKMFSSSHTVFFYNVLRGKTYKFQFVLLSNAFISAVVTFSYYHSSGAT